MKVLKIKKIAKFYLRIHHVFATYKSYFLYKNIKYNFIFIIF